MDLKQAALFYKNRWKWRKDVSEHQERQVAAVAKAKAQKAVAKSNTNSSDTGASKKPVSNNGQEKIGGKTDREERRHQDQQELATGFVRQTLAAVHGMNEAAAVKISDAALTLLRQNDISAQDLLTFSRVVNAADKNSPVVKAAVEKHRAGFTARQKSLWSDVLKEIQELESKERKGEKIEFSSKFAEDTVSVMDLFMGPAAPLVKVGRDFVTEHKEDAVKLGRAAHKLTKSIASRVPLVKTIGRRASVLFDRFLPGVKQSLRRLTDKIKESSGGGLLGKIGGVGGKAIGVAQFIGRSELAQTALILGGIAAVSVASKVKNYVGEKVEAVKNSAPVKFINSVTKDIVKFLGDTSTSLYQFASDVGQELKSFGGSIWARLVSEFETIKTSLIESPVGALFTNVQNTIEYLWQWIKGFMPSTTKTAGVDQQQSYDANGNVTGVISSDSPTAGAKGDGTSNVSAASAVTAIVDKTAIKFYGGATLEGANPAMVSNLYSMASEYKQITGKNIQLNDGKRSNAEQAALYSKFPGKAAPPGQSMHEFGLAIDINSADAEALTRLGLMSKYGFTRPVAGEKWHVEPVAIQSMKASIRKNGAVAETTVAVAKPAVESETAASQPVDNKTNNTTVSGSTQQPLVNAVKTGPSAVAARFVGNNGVVADGKDTKAEGKSAISIAQEQLGVKTLGSMGGGSEYTPQAPIATAYERQPSYSKTINKVVDTIPQENEQNKKMVTQKDGSDVPFYVGDLGLVTFNLGVI